MKLNSTVSTSLLEVRKVKCVESSPRSRILEGSPACAHVCLHNPLCLTGTTHHIMVKFYLALPFPGCHAWSIPHRKQPFSGKTPASHCPFNPLRETEECKISTLYSRSEFCGHTDKGEQADCA